MAKKFEKPVEKLEEIDEKSIEKLDYAPEKEEILVKEPAEHDPVVQKKALDETTDQMLADLMTHLDIVYDFRRSIRKPHNHVFYLKRQLEYLRRMHKKATR